MDLREQNEQYVGRFFKRDVEIALLRYTYISGFDEDGLLVGTELVPETRIIWEARYPGLDGFEEATRDEFEKTFEDMIETWRVW